MEKRTNYLLNLALGCAVVMGIFVLYALLIFYFAKEDDGVGTFGDAFGALNALFAGLAFAGLIVTIRQQSADLQATREEMRDGNIESAKMTLESSLFSYLKLMEKCCPENHDELQGRVMENMQRVKKLYSSEKINDEVLKELYDAVNDLRELLSKYGAWRRTFYSWCLRIDEEQAMAKKYPEMISSWKKRLWHLLSKEECCILYLQTAYLSAYHEEEWKAHEALVKDEKRLSVYFQYWKESEYNFLISCLAAKTNGSGKKLSKPQIQEILETQSCEHRKPLM